MRRKLRSLFEFQRAAAETAQQAKACFAAGDYERAEALFSILLQDEAAADRLAHYCNRSACRLKLGRHDDAAADARVALEISPDSVKAHFRLASALVDRAERCSGAEGGGRRAEAAAACSAALALHPGHAQLLALAARCAEEESAPSAASAPAESAAPPAPTAGDGDGGVAEEDYAEWCRQTANRLYGEGEFGQAVAWYGHALSALGASSAAAAPPPTAPAADGAEGSGDADDGDAAAVVTLLSNRAAAALKLGRWADAAADARAAAARDARAIKARVRGSAALLQMGEMQEALAFATAAVAAAAPADDDGGARRLSELRALPAKELRQRERELRRELDRLRDEGTSGERHVPRGRGRRPAAPTAASDNGGGGGGGALEKDELAAVVAEAEREVVAEGAEAALAKRAVREAEAMISRVGEVGEMAVAKAGASRDASAIRWRQRSDCLSTVRRSCGAMRLHSAHHSDGSTLACIRGCSIRPPAPSPSPPSPPPPSPAGAGSS